MTAMTAVLSSVGALVAPKGIPEDARARLQDGRYEEAILIAAASVLQPDDIVIEAGGGVGLVALKLSDLVADVWTIEAHPDYYEALRENVRDSANVHPLHGVLTAGPGMETAFYLAEDWRGSSVAPEVGRKVTVPLVNLGALARQTQATALVLDVEGHEVSLVTEVNDLPRLRALVVEWHPSLTTPEERGFAARWLSEIGYRRVARPDGDRPVEAWIA